MPTALSVGSLLALQATMIRLLFVFALVCGCSGQGQGLDGADKIPCGDLTCGSSEYCVSESTVCCYPGCDAGIDPPRDFSCKPIPTGCVASHICECAEAKDAPGGVPVTCEPDDRMISFGCV